MVEGEPDKMLTTEEAAKVLGVQHGTVRSYVARKLINAVKRGSTNFVLRSDVERFKAEHDPSPGPKPTRKDNGQ